MSTFNVGDTVTAVEDHKAYGLKAGRVYTVTRCAPETHLGETVTLEGVKPPKGCEGFYVSRFKAVTKPGNGWGWIENGAAAKATVPGENGPEVMVPDVVDILKDHAPDVVAMPAHYRNHPSGVECITITQHMNFCRGNAIKYVWRAGEKGGKDKEIEDLRKARQYLDIEIKRLESAKND